MVERGEKPIKAVIKTVAQQPTLRVERHLMTNALSILTHPFGDHVFAPSDETMQRARDQLTEYLNLCYPDLSPEEIEAKKDTLLTLARERVGTFP